MANLTILREHAYEFLDYLQQRQLKKDNVYTKETLEQLHSKLFKDEKEKTANFAYIWYVLVNGNHICRIGDNIYFSDSRNQSPDLRSSTKTSNVRNASNVASKTAKRKRRRRVAVDQHLTTAQKRDKPTGGATSTDTGDVSAGIELPSGVRERAGPRGGYTCQMCSQTCGTWLDMEKHVDSRRHRAGMLTLALKLNR